jgi:hypothetical protein
MSKNMCDSALMKYDCSGFYVCKTLNQFGEIDVLSDNVLNIKSTYRNQFLQELTILNKS